MAKRRPRCSLPISSRMKGNFWTVEMMIFLPDSMNRSRSPERFAWPTVERTWTYFLIVSWICRSRMTRSVTTIIESKTGAPSFSSQNQLMGQPSDPSNSCRCPPSAGSGSACPPHVSQHQPATAAPPRADGSAARSGPASSSPSSYPSTPPPGCSSPGCWSGSCASVLSRHR